ncbi:hypothetical protein [Psychrobacter sp. 72-O-c]|uniref:hypothetical protein n=1 Tax=Psychrobacter sp. 72-O-c TaxID=2774125 RepID=UPI001919AE75|nr:hypothetical protein [Psychrobacter sp. 72-O-c]
MLTSGELRSILNFDFEWSINWGTVCQLNNEPSRITYNDLEGQIRFNEKKQLALYLEKEIDSSEFSSIHSQYEGLFRNSSAGELIVKEKYFQLSFTDNKGREWVTSHFLLNDSVVIGHRKIIIDVLITNIDLVNSRKLNSFYAYYSKELEIIPNKRSIGIDGIQQLNKYELILENYTLRIVKIEGISILSLVSSVNNIEENFHIYKLIREAINIICSYPINYNIENQYDNGSLVTRVYSRRFYDRGNTPPIPSSHTNNKNIDRFISQYVIFFQENIYSSSSALYIWWYRLYGYTLDIENKLLILSVAVESIVLKYIRKEDANNKIYDCNEIKKLGKLVKNTDVSKSLKRRVQKYLGNLNSSSKPLVSILNELANSGTLLKDMNIEWQLLRNDAAHGVERSLNGENEAQMQRVIYEANYLEEVFFRLVFYIISYEGDFRQFSKLGYPLDHLEISNKDKY